MSRRACYPYPAAPRGQCAVTNPAPADKKKAIDTPSENVLMSQRDSEFGVKDEINGSMIAVIAGASTSI